MSLSAVGAAAVVLFHNNDKNVATWKTEEQETSSSSSFLFPVTHCDEYAPTNLEQDTLRAQKLNISDEGTRFQVALSKHQRNLPYYKSKWASDRKANGTRLSISTWPQDIPTTEEIPALRSEMKYCRRSPNYRDDTMYCQQVQFRIATVLLQTPEVKVAAEGLAIIKDLAERGHPDAMCMYGICLNEGRAGLDPNALQGVVWLRRCAELHGHAQALCELGVAFYTGEGVMEDEAQAVKYFQMAADDGHPGASYLLGDCLMDGFGVEKDRAAALERFIDAAERGHRGARSRVLAMLERNDGQAFGLFTDASRQTLIPDYPSPSGASDSELRLQQESDQSPALRLERRFTIGGVPPERSRYSFGGTSPPAVIARRKTIVEESRRI